MSLTSSTIRPFTATTTIIKSGTSYYNSATTGTLGATEFRLLRGIVALGSAGKASTLQLIIEDNSNTWFSTLTVGSTVYIAIGKKGATALTTVFGGLIERTRINREQKNVTELTIDATDWTQLLMNKVVMRYSKHQKRDTTGQILRDDAVNMKITDAIVELMGSSQNTVYLNGINSGISAALSTAGGAITANDTSIPDIDFPYKPLHDCVKELFDHLRYTWGVTADAALYGRPDESAPDSGVTLDTSTIINLSVEDDISDTKNRIFVVGSDEVKVGVSSSSHIGGTLNTSSIYIAEKFAATADDLRYVQLFLEKFGDPANLTIAIYQDSANSPTGAVVRVAEINKLDVKTTATSFAQSEINEKVTTGELYWLVIFRSADTTGVPASANYYKWYTDGGSGATTATSSDNVTWTVVSGTSTLAHQLWFGNPNMYPAPNLVSISTYGERQLSWREPEIENLEQGIMLGTALSQFMGKKKQTLQITSYAPEAILEPGRLVTVGETSLVTTSYIMTDVTYELQAHESYFVQVSAMRFV